tara:strand:+ start:68 stop:1027 length:960 start_codon:yes stop_codon:yes gene_type:complete
MKKVLVTGGSGLIGLELCKQLLNSGFKVFCLDLPEQIKKNQIFLKPLRNKITIIEGSIFERSLIKELCNKVDIVFHLAAMLGVQRTEENKLKCLDINIKGTEIVVEASISAKNSHFVFASSSEVYGEPTSNPVTENIETKGKTVYAVSKLTGEEYIKGFSQIHKNFKYTIVRFFNTYGENQVNQFFLAKIVRNIISNKDPIVYGNGKQVRSFCHVEDSCNALVKIIKTKKSHNKIFNIGNSSEIYSLNEAATKAIAVLRKKLNVKNVPFSKSDRTREREILTRYCDTSFAKKTLFFRPKITLEEGIKRLSKNKTYISDW